MQELWNSELASFAATVGMLAGYHLWLAWHVRKAPNYTVQAVLRAARTAWVAHVMQNPGRDIMAVQTLRNSTMAATFMASTAVLLIVGVLTLTGQSDRLGQTWHALNLFGGHDPELRLAKLLILLMDMVVAFFGFSMSIRLYNHVGYLINVPVKLRHPAIDAMQVARHLNRAGRFYSIGMRAYYFAVPLVFWLFGPHFMLAAALLLVPVLYYLDRTP